MPNTRPRIIDSAGNPGRMKRSCIRKHEAAGEGAWNPERSVFVFHPKPQGNTTGGSVGSDCAMAGRVRMVDLVNGHPEPVVITEASREGFLPYPQASQVSGRKLRDMYPALARRGAGLCA